MHSAFGIDHGEFSKAKGLSKPAQTFKMKSHARLKALEGSKPSAKLGAMKGAVAAPGAGAGASGGAA